MSIEVAKAWVRDSIRSQDARNRALAMLDQASAEGVEATLIIGKNLATKRRCYAARWNGREVIVLELSPELQNAFGVIPNGVFQQLERFQREFLPPCEPWIEIGNVRLEPKKPSDAQSQICGTCTYVTRQPVVGNLHSCALHADYFRPDLPRAISSFWYPQFPPALPSGTLSFQFPTFKEISQELPTRGPVVLFLQLVTAQNWQRHEGLQKISNLLAVIANA